MSSYRWNLPRPGSKFLSMFRHLRYFYHCLAHPHLIDFVDMGLGIEARYRRCAPEWDEHLNASKSFQARALTLWEGGGIAAVLGAGRLLDLDAQLLSRTFSSVRLYDADPSARRPALWKFPSGARAAFFLVELSGTLQSWTRALKDFLRAHSRDPHALAAFLRGLRLAPAPLRLDDADFVFSVSVLSQIPLFWRDRVQALAARAWGIHPSDTGDLPEPILSAVKAGMALLQAAHLRLINESSCRGVILISDTTFDYYECSRLVLSEPALLVSPESELVSFTPALRESWCWKIAPQGKEQAEYGVVHQVQALYFTHKNSKSRAAFPAA